MSKLVGTATEALRRAVCAAMEAAMEAGDLPRAELLNLPWRSGGPGARGLGATRRWRARSVLWTAPRKIAEAVAAHLLDGTYFERAEIAGPGFLNFSCAAAFTATCCGT